MTESLEADKRIPQAHALLNAVHLLPLTSGLLDRAARLPDPGLRALDAIHLASALSIREDVTAFVGYDRRLADTAAAEGFEVVAPGT